MPDSRRPGGLIVGIRHWAALGYHRRQLGFRLFVPADSMQGNRVFFSQVQRPRRGCSICTLRAP